MMDSAQKARIRRAFADYVCSEGCSCCRNVPEHDKAMARLAKMLDIPKYDDGSGYDVYQFRTPRSQARPEDDI